MNFENYMYFCMCAGSVEQTDIFKPCPKVACVLI